MNRAKELLRGVMEAKLEVLRCDHELMLLNNQARSITAKMSGMPGGGGDPHKDGILIRIADRETKLNELKTEYAQRILRAGRLIDRIPEPIHRAILTMRYLELMSWPQILEELACAGILRAERWLFEQHGKALYAANLILENDNYENSNCKD